MEALNGLMHGFSIALQPANLLWGFVGCFLGTVIGILPGLGPAATIALLLPVTYTMDPTGGIIMLAGIYYGAKYGGSTTSILLNMPGEASSVVSCIDGYQMARNGRAGAALGIAAIASFIAGSVGLLLLTFVAPPVSNFALRFSSPEYFALMVMGLSLVALLSGTSMVKAILSLVIGLWLATVGTDLFTAQARYVFDRPELLGGIDFMTVAIGVFAIAEILLNIESKQKSELLNVPRGLRNLLPTWQELMSCRTAFINGSVTGFIIGLLPGAGATVASFVSYGIQKAISREPEKFGHGAPEGLAAPEAANNADTGGALLPLLTFGIPGGSSTAVLLSALILWGIKPGPLMMQESPDVFWGLVASLYVGNVILLIMNLPLVGVFAQILRVPIYILHPAILGVAVAGVYGTAGNLFDIGLLVAFGLLGFAMSKASFPVAPLILGFVLGQPMERAIRQSLAMSDGHFSILVARPISAVLLAMACVILILPLWNRFRSVKEEAVTGEAA